MVSQFGNHHTHCNLQQKMDPSYGLRELLLFTQGLNPAGRG
jgi:hypothetical protein